MSTRLRATMDRLETQMQELDAQFAKWTSGVCPTEEERQTVLAKWAAGMRRATNEVAHAVREDRPWTVTRALTIAVALLRQACDAAAMYSDESQTDRASQRGALLLFFADKVATQTHIIVDAVTTSAAQEAQLLKEAASLLQIKRLIENPMTFLEVKTLLERLEVLRERAKRRKKRASRSGRGQLANELKDPGKSPAAVKASDAEKGRADSHPSDKNKKPPPNVNVPPEQCYCELLCDEEERYWLIVKRTARRPGPREELKRIRMGRTQARDLAKAIERVRGEAINELNAAARAEGRPQDVDCLPDGLTLHLTWTNTDWDDLKSATRRKRRQRIAKLLTVKGEPWIQPVTDLGEEGHRTVIRVRISS